MQSSANFSDCGRYRYRLRRRWADGEECVFVGLNPSTADGAKNDATVRKCMQFARTWGFAGLVLVNLFARRCRYPQALATSDDPVGPDNAAWLAGAVKDAPLVIAMWGNHGARAYGEVSRRDLRAMDLRDDWRCFGHTKQGAPKHPLYLPNETQLQTFSL